ncbi:flavodoxin family protein [Desulfonauticus submarinus]
MSEKILLISGSPNKNGTTETLALKAKVFLEARGYSVRLFSLAREQFYACQGCQRCMQDSFLGRCVFESKDNIYSLFQEMLILRKVFFFAPIYFYHLPGRCKGFIDRAQSFYALQQRNKLNALPGLLKAVLVAGRFKGNKLFIGTELTLTYFASIFCLSVKVCGLRGLDAPKHISQQVEEKVFSFLSI